MFMPIYWDLKRSLEVLVIRPRCIRGHDLYCKGRCEMNVQLIRAEVEQRQILSNLVQFYLHDFSSYIDLDVESNGRYTDYPLLDYWTKPKHDPYFVIVDNCYAGFVLVKQIEIRQRPYHSIAEFFIMRKYRRQGLGRLVARQIFQDYEGRWHVSQLKENQPAQTFWRKVIEEWTDGEFTEHIGVRKITHFFNQYICEVESECFPSMES